jgi:MYXO-CTERM domain-containing protein
MGSVKALLFVALVSIGTVGVREARADLGPPKTCNLDGKGCETCDVGAGKEDPTCATAKKASGLVLTCQSGGASNGLTHYCKPGTKEAVAKEEDGCNQAPGPMRAASVVTVLAALGLLGAVMRRRRS